MFIVLKRILNLSWNNISRNASLSLVAFFIIFLTVFLATFIFTVRDFSSMVVEDVRDQIGISVYFKAGVDEETIFETKESILTLKETKSVRYASRSEIFENFIERHKDNPVIMASLAETGNPFLSSLSVKSDTAEGYEVIASYLKESSSRIFFEKIDYDQKKSTIDNIFYITSLTQRIGFTLAGIFSLIAVLLVFSIVRLTLYEMREEIKTMRLVGVSKRFLQGLFVMQGTIIGAASFLFSFLIIFGFGFLFNQNLSSLIPGFEISPYLKANFLFIFLMQMLIGVGLGMISSIAATAKYLRK